MKDPAFLFYPGDYLRDTQCLCEKAQVAYDRIMCEHMRNICISKQQLNFFTKRLSDDEKNELLHLLTEVKGGYQIQWVAESIIKRLKYSESRRKNRSKTEKTYDEHMRTYDEHMENENENEIEDVNKEKRGMGKKEKEDKILIDVPENFQPIVQDWLEYKKSRKESYKSQQSIRAFTNKLLKLSLGDPQTAKNIIEQSMANNWAGIFELKNNDNTSKKNNSAISQDYKRSVYERLHGACSTDGL